MKRNPALINEIKETLEKELSEKFGASPMKAPISALITQAWKDLIIQQANIMKQHGCYLMNCFVLFCFSLLRYANYRGDVSAKEGL
jgi:hypothetical protein